MTRWQPIRAPARFRAAVTARTRRTGPRERGSAALETAILAPGLLVLLALLLQAGWWYMARSTAHAAAAEGARAGRVRDAPPGAATTAARQFAAEVGSGALHQVSVDTDGSDAGTVAVTVRGRAPSFVPFFEPTVSQTVRAPHERFTVPGDSP
ncbi:TadE/TadG family type IV pilus assembly protein [Actinomadura sp. 7K507]|uniref:TadE/TadG family type IV pilus assembly protein n=1 Tax=Actinomadura sp. 7K507 TaxID=2530365 RepID=UPI001043FA8C|nr:TadE/TadG family type IV pilus assembly protein [Actinomadura sp. 7K507]TDC79748.1 pilus assembly protein [Actinomadura sp. 7K507]